MIGYTATTCTHLQMFNKVEVGAYRANQAAPVKSGKARNIRPSSLFVLLSTYTLLHNPLSIYRENIAKTQKLCHTTDGRRGERVPSPRGFPSHPGHPGHKTSCKAKPCTTEHENTEDCLGDMWYNEIARQRSILFEATSAAIKQIFTPPQNHRLSIPTGERTYSKSTCCRCGRELEQQRLLFYGW
jgi:hypothetical protein